MGAPQGGTPALPLAINGSVCLQLVEDQYSLLPGHSLPLWALLYLSFGGLFVVGLTVVSCKFTSRENSPPARRVFSVAYWVVSIALLVMGIIHFSASFDQGLLTVTKMVMTICIHMVIFGAQVSIIYFYYVSEHLTWTLYEKIRKTMIPTALTAFIFGVMEASFVGANWSSSVLERGIGSLTTFWIIIRASLVIAYATTLIVGLIPWTTMHFPSTASFVSQHMGPSILDLHILIMLSIQIVGLVGRIGTSIFTNNSTFGCVAASAFLSEYVVFVPSSFACAAWLFRVRPLENLAYTIIPDGTSETETDIPVPIPRRAPAKRKVPPKGATDSEFAFMSSDYDTDRY